MPKFYIILFVTCWIHVYKKDAAELICSNPLCDRTLNVSIWISFIVICKIVSVHPQWRIRKAATTVLSVREREKKVWNFYLKKKQPLSVALNLLMRDFFTPTNSTVTCAQFCYNNTLTEHGSNRPSMQKQRSVWCTGTSVQHLMPWCLLLGIPENHLHVPSVDGIKVLSWRITGPNISSLSWTVTVW